MKARQGATFLRPSAQSYVEHTEVRSLFHYKVGTLRNNIKLCCQTCANLTRPTESFMKT